MENLWSGPPAQSAVDLTFSPVPLSRIQYSRDAPSADFVQIFVGIFACSFYVQTACMQSDRPLFPPRNTKFRPQSGLARPPPPDCFMIGIWSGRNPHPAQIVNYLLSFVQVSTRLIRPKVPQGGRKDVSAESRKVEDSYEKIIRSNFDPSASHEFWGK